MDGSFLKYLPKNQRTRIIDKKPFIESELSPPSKDIEKINKQKLKEIFYLSRYHYIYGINFLNKDLKCDQSIRLDQVIQGIDKNKFLSLKLEKSGIPLPFSVIYNLIHNKAIDKLFKDVDLSESIYIFSQEERYQYHPKSSHTFVKKDYYIFLRVLESGAMIKLSQIDEKQEQIVYHRKTTNKKIIIDLKDSEKKINSFLESTDGLIQKLFNFLNVKSKNDPKITSLSNIIFKVINNYNCVQIKNTNVSELSRNYDEEDTSMHKMSKIQRTSIMKDKTKPIQIPCSVTGCSMMREKNDNQTPMMILYLYKSITDFKGVRIKSSSKSYNSSIRLCEEHGYLIASVWYLFNQFKIWSFNIFQQLRLFTNSTKNISIFMLYATFSNISKEMIKEKERMELSIAYIKEWIEKNETNHAKTSSSDE